MANPESAEVEKIIRTRELVDPNQTGIVVGTSGIALYFRGFEWPVKPVGDLDLLLPDNAAIRDAKERLEHTDGIRSAEFWKLQIAGRSASMHNKLEILPRDLEEFLPAQMFTATVDAFHAMTTERAYKLRTDVLGEKTLPLDTLLEWKMRALREKDKGDGVTLTEFAIKNAMVSPVAARSLARVIEHVRNTTITNTRNYGFGY